MAPPVKHSNIQNEYKNLINTYRKKYLNKKFIKTLIFDPSKLYIVTFFILIGELILNVFVVHRVNYTEIDWVAYMQECEGFLNGTTDYSLLKGDTGPLVYPAGFVYIYSIFYYLTSHGQNIQLAQYIFIIIYLLQMFLVLRLYGKSRKLPPYVLVISAFTSYRIHSIYVLRLFNDPIAILFFYVALNFFMDNKWSLGSLMFSIAVSVKMNILLFAPAVLVFYITNLGYWKTVQQLALCALVQLVLGTPFLLTHPIEYLIGSFNLGRVFEHKWTVNYRFLDRDLFENKIFHLALLGLHVVLLIIFFSPSFKYFQSYCRLRALERQLQPQIDAQNKQNKKKLNKRKEKTDGEVLTQDQEKFLASFEKGLKKGASSTPLPETRDNDKEKYSIHFDQSTQLALLPIFLSNFIGIICSRSLHYQFYVWYFHSLPYLAWSTDYSTSVKFLLLALIEFAWNTYPSTSFSSLLLHGCHIFLLYGIQRKIFKDSTAKEKTN